MPRLDVNWFCFVLFLNFIWFHCYRKINIIIDLQTQASVFSAAGMYSVNDVTQVCTVFILTFILLSFDWVVQCLQSPIVMNSDHVTKYTVNTECVLKTNVNLWISTSQVSNFRAGQTACVISVNLKQMYTIQRLKNSPWSVIVFSPVYSDVLLGSEFVLNSLNELHTKLYEIFTEYQKNPTDTEI